MTKLPVNKNIFFGLDRLFSFLVLTLTLLSCDSPDDIPVQQVNSQDRLNDTELQQLREHPPYQGDELFHSHKVLSFGFDLRSSPQEDAAQYLPFLKYLEKTTGYQFKLHFTPKNSSTVDELGNNKSQLAAMGATSFLEARSRYKAISLVQGLNQQNKTEYQSVFVVRPDSRIRTMNDIKGHKLAFGSVDSTQGHLIPRIMLTENKIQLKDLLSYGYTDSHQNCAEAVVSGKYDVCGMQDQLAKKLANQGALKIIYTSRYYPSSGIVVNKSVPSDVAAKIKQALIDFEPQGKHSSGLYHWDRTEMPRGFIEATDSDYISLHNWSIQLGFLKENNQ